MIITLDTETKGINLPGIGIRTFKNLEVIDENSKVGKVLLESFPQYCNTKVEFVKPVKVETKEVKKEPELLLEEPVQEANVETVEEVKQDETVETIEEPVQVETKTTPSKRASKTKK